MVVSSASRPITPSGMPTSGRALGERAPAPEFPTESATSPFCGAVDDRLEVGAGFSDAQAS